MSQAPPLTGAITALQLLQYLSGVVATGYGDAPVVLYWDGTEARDGLMPCYGLALREPTRYRPYNYLEPF